MDADNKALLCVLLYLVISFAASYGLLSIKGILYRLGTSIKAWLIKNVY
jgi:hypothetical protein